MQLYNISLLITQKVYFKNIFNGSIGNKHMHRKINLLYALILIIFIFIPVTSEDFFSGTWCIGDERLVITFKDSDTLQFYSLEDESINGKGTYEGTDSTLTAIVANDELEVRLGYRYRKKNNSKLKAKFLFFIIDGDSVDHPRRWMRMERCNPDTFSTPEEETGEE